MSSYQAAYESEPPGLITHDLGSTNNADLDGLLQKKDLMII